MDQNNKAYFRKDLIFLDESFPDRVTFFKSIGRRLAAKGIVHETFMQGIMEREKNYPTGLPILPDAVAVPHCDPKFIIEETISIVRFAHKVKFYEMSTTDKELDVKFAFVLTMKSMQQVPILQDLIALFNDKTFMDLLRRGGAEEIMEWIKNN